MRAKQPTSSSRQPVDGTPSALSPMLVSLEQATTLLNVGRTTMYRLIADGEVVPIHIGRSVRFVVRELEDYVATLQAAR